MNTIDESEFDGKRRKLTNSKLCEENALNRAIYETQSGSSYLRDKEVYNKNQMSQNQDKTSSNFPLNLDSKAKSIIDKLVHGSIENTKNSEGFGSKNFSMSKRKLKVLPGGKYGLLTFVKHFGSPLLKQLSPGMILSLIKKAISINYISYIKVFCVFVCWLVL